MKKQSTNFACIFALFFSQGQQSRLQSQISAAAGVSPSEYNPFKPGPLYDVNPLGVQTFASGVILNKDVGGSPTMDYGQHVGKVLAATDNKAKVSLYEHQPYYEKFYDRIDMLPGVDRVSGHVSLKLTGTDDYLCYQNYPQVDVFWATEQAGFSPQQCSWDRVAHPHPNFGPIYHNIRSFDNRWLSVVGSGGLELQGTVGSASSGNGGTWWINTGPATGSSAPSPPSAGPVSLIGKGSKAGYLQDGSLPSNEDELEFFKLKTGSYCRGPADFNWTSLYNAIVAQGEARCQANLEAAKNASYASGLQNGNITGFMAGVAVGQTRGYQTGFQNGQRSFR